MKLRVNVVFRLLLIIMIFIVPVVVTAQTVATNKLAQHTSAGLSFPANALILMADGSEKYISEVKKGEAIASYDPVADGYTTTLVRKMQAVSNASFQLVSVMLILEDLSVSLQANGGLAGVTLQATSDQSVLTVDGKKTLGQLQEGDKLYCFDEASGKFHAFTVYAIQNQPAIAGNMYSLETDNNIYLINSTVVLGSN